jgi:hypothetical protein
MHSGNIKLVSPGTVKVFKDQETMSEATVSLDDAIENLNTIQSSATGVTFERTDTPCPTPYDGSCITIES